MTSMAVSFFSTNPPPHFSSPLSKLPFSYHPTKWCVGRIGKRPARVWCAKVGQDQWLEKLPDKKKPLYSHSLPCIEAWLRNLGFQPSREDRAAWTVEKPEWHAQLSLDVTDLYIRYLKSGPGDLEKDVERRFSYALSREDIENAILGGP